MGPAYRPHLTCEKTMVMHPVFRFLDPYLIWFYRISGQAYVDFVIGTLALAFLTLIIGEYTISLAFLAIRKQVDRVNQEALKYQNLTMGALKAGDKPSYTAVNKLANDAFGKVFFLQIALSAALLWPVPLVLAWMQYRFGDGVPLCFPPILWALLGFSSSLRPAYFLFKRIKYRMPYLRRMKAILESYDHREPPLQSAAPDSQSGPLQARLDRRLTG